MNLPVWLGPVCALGASVSWALGSTAYSQMSRVHSPFAVNFSRAALAFPLFVIAVGITEGARTFEALASVGETRLSWLAVSIFASYGAGDVLFMWSAKEIGVPAALAIGSIYPLWAALIGRLTGQPPMAWGQVGGLWLTVAGVIAVILSARGAHLQGARKTLTKGVLLALGCSFMWMLNTFATGRGGLGVSPVVANFYRMIFAMVLATLGGWIFARRETARTGIPVISTQSIRKYWWVFPIEAFVGSMIFTYGLAHSPLFLGATLASLSPVMAVPISWSLGLEKPSVERSLGVLTVVVGLWLLVGAG